MKPIFLMVCKLLIASTSFSANSAGDQQLHGVAIPAEFTIQHDQIEYEGDPLEGGIEKMGFTGVILNLRPGNHLHFGPGIYGATTGERGGFIVAGFNVGLRYQLAPWAGLETELFFGGGGGSSANRLVESGLMLRPSVGLTLYSRAISVGVGYSLVRFPTGAINSKQPYVKVSFATDFFAVKRLGGSSSAPLMSRDDLVRDPIWLTPMLRIYRSEGRVNIDGLDHDPTVALAGFSFIRFLKNRRFFFEFDAFGAFDGGVAGYMSISAGLGYMFPLSRWLYISPGFHVGHAGGDKVDTKGGLTLEPKLDLRLQMGRTTQIYFSSSYLNSVSGSFDVPTLSAGVGIFLDSFRSKTDVRERRTYSLSGTRMREIRFSLSTQRYFIDGTPYPGDNSFVFTDIDLMGFNFDFFVLPWLFLNGGTYWAFGGNAGSYASGLLGAGLHQDIGPLYLELSFNSGVGAGGGIPAGSAAMNKFKGSLGISLIDSISLFGSAGQIYYPTGIDAFVAEVGLGYRFGFPIP